MTDLNIHIQSVLAQLPSVTLHHCLSVPDEQVVQFLSNIIPGLSHDHVDFVKACMVERNHTINKLQTSKPAKPVKPKEAMFPSQPELRFICFLTCLN
ncbi:hypothetical protein GEMRC1_005005 [Eukaryota sp. GEM-RC1]